MKRKDCDNYSSNSLGIVCWLPLFVLEALSFEPMRPYSQKFDHFPYEVECCLFGNPRILHKLLRPCHSFSQPLSLFEPVRAPFQFLLPYYPRLRTRPDFLPLYHFILLFL